MSSASSADTVTSDAVDAAAGTAGQLSEQQKQILAMERQWWKYAGAKDQAISDELQISAVAYYQLLNQLIDSEAALVHDPMLVKRLRRQREARQRARASRR
ncbi:DUF3263 domain-containing protein [Nesterenkonia sp. HG001]|uniref:DUF3263 domain-containing protein n=1 Tax=Nesterenkonia sp. HG001 TaxID=2983207 RepID=UPI002AC5D14F|nr:DUF3263 domain-containing protein [Nesterenkonia sp. HG001]MDZ5078927.1 DUF3263 domain-containing protein [Nesterenkonia sp. HG001]